MARGEYIRTPMFRGSFPFLFEKQLDPKGVEEGYCITMIFDRDQDISEIKRILHEAEKERWPSGRPEKFSYPIQDGNTKNLQKYPYLKDKIFIKLKNKKLKPDVLDLKSKRTLTIEDSSLIYGGAYYKATISAFAWSFRSTNGVGLSMVSVIKIKDGEPLGRRTTDIYTDYSEDIAEYEANNREEFDL